MDNFVKNNKELVLLILTWVTLIFYMCLKLFFGYYVEYTTSNENFINFCNLVDNNTILGIILPTITSYIMLYLYYCTILSQNKLNINQNIILILFIIISVVISEFIPNISFVSDLLKFFIAPFIMYYFKGKLTVKHLIVVSVGYVVNPILQLISLISRNIDLNHMVQDSSFVSLLLSLDVILMLTLHYLYERRIKLVGFWLGKWFGQEISWLKSQREKKLKRIAALQSEVKEIDDEISRQEKEAK